MTRKNKFIYLFWGVLIAGNILLGSCLYFFESKVVDGQEIVWGYHSDVLLLILHCILIGYAFISSLFVGYRAGNYNGDILLKDFAKVMAIIVFCLNLFFIYYTLDPDMSWLHNIIIELFKH